MSFFRSDGRLQHLLAEALAAAGAPEPSAGGPDAAAACLVAPDAEGALRGASVQAHRLFYPASLVKLFHATAYMLAVDTGRLEPVEEDERALAAMLRQSSDDADQYLVGRLTGAPPQVWLDGDALTAWMGRRAALGETIAALHVPEFAGMVIAHPTFADGPFGAEHRFRQAQGGNRLSPLAMTRLLAMLTGAIEPAVPGAGRIVGWLDRAPARRTGGDRTAQVGGCLAQDLPADIDVWSKAGWTSSVRHDAAWLRWPSGASAWLVVMTSGDRLAASESFLPTVGRHVVQALGNLDAA